MKKLQLILTFLIVLVIGVFIGKEFERQLGKKNGSKKLEVAIAAPPRPKLSPSPGYKLINFLIREQNSGDIREKETRMAVENLFNSNKVRFIFKTFGRATENATHESNLNHMGLIDASRVAEQISNGKELIPLFTASPNSQHECFSEIEIVTKKQIQSLEELSGKSLGLENISVSIGKILLKQLKDNNIKFKKIHVYDSKDRAVHDLTNEKIDAIFDRASVFDNGLVTSRIGLIQNGAFSHLPDFKILSTSAFKIPCKVIFINSHVSAPVREELEKKFEDIFSQPNSRELITRGILVGSIRKITPESWQTIESRLKDVSAVELSAFAPEVISEKP